MLAEPPRTPYDLNFRLLGFPVRIHPLFWLGAALLGSRALNAGLDYMAIWIGVVFVSLLVHELGHAIAFRRFGSDAHIVLYIFFGLAVGSPEVRGRGRRIMVSLAGPLAGFLVAGVLYASHAATGWGNSGTEQVAFLYGQLIFANVAWGVLNLFPVFPLDGGQVSRELCEGKWRGRGLQVALKISVGVGAAVALYSLVCEYGVTPDSPLAGIPWWAQGTLFTAVLFGLLAVQNYLLLQQAGRGYYYESPDDKVSWEK